MPKDDDDLSQMIQSMPSAKRNIILQTFSVRAAIHFSHRVKAFAKTLLVSSAVWGTDVQDYWIRVEFQGRGSPHIHLFLWMNNKEINTKHLLSALENTSKIKDIIEQYHQISIPSDSPQNDKITYPMYSK
jgi:hypothetical protein